MDSFWRARGVWDEQQRNRLIGCLDRSASSAQPQLDQAAPLPGVGAASRLEDPQGLAEVQHVSKQLLQLHQALGSRGDIDVVSMVMREPRLVWVSSSELLQRLIQMKIAARDQDVDVGKVAEAQPSLLLADHQSSDEDDELQSGADQLEAWRHGLASDGSAEWAARLAQLQQYVQQHGDAHAGLRTGDDVELGRWAAAQRAAYADGRLAADRVSVLTALGFEFEEEAAEWRRWYNELRNFQAAEGHCGVSPLASSSAFLLINWCSVQRIAKRSRMLAADRIQLLDDLKFDWDGSDPLS